MEAMILGTVVVTLLSSRPLTIPHSLMVAVAKQVQSTLLFMTRAYTQSITAMLLAGTLEKKRKDNETKFLTTAKAELGKSVSDL